MLSKVQYVQLTRSSASLIVSVSELMMNCLVSLFTKLHAAYVRRKGDQEKNTQKPKLAENSLRSRISNTN
jgi:predicted peroxiredoxin